MYQLPISRRLATLTAALSIVIGSDSFAAGFGKKKSCDTCPPSYPAIIEESTSPPSASTEVQPKAADSADAAQPPNASSPQAANNALETNSAFDQALAGQYDVASASNFAAPNMVGDFFGAAGGTTVVQGFTDGGFYPTRVTPINTSPGTGGGVGRLKLAENTSVLPQDRVYFGYQYFNGVPLTANGTNVNRYVPGFEKTFFNGNTSVEVRVPFAGTLDSTQDVTNIGATNTQLGNVTVFLKGLIYSSDTVAFGGGLSITTPTANDQVVTQNGSDILRVKNQGTHLAPYLGLVYMPGRFFTQIYGQYDVDATGRSVYMLDNSTNALAKAGDYSDTSVLFLDWNVGYWIYKNPGSFITGIAPIFEVHYNQALGNADTVNNGSINNGNVTTILTDTNANYSIVNLTAGSHFVFGQRSTLTLAGVVPVTNNNNRSFNGELQVLFNYYFGRLNRYTTLPANF